MENQNPIEAEGENQCQALAIIKFHQQVARHLQKPVHHHTSWLSVAACSIASFLIITTVLFAQKELPLNPTPPREMAPIVTEPTPVHQEIREAPVNNTIAPTPEPFQQPMPLTERRQETGSTYQGCAPGTSCEIQSGERANLQAGQERKEQPQGLSEEEEQERQQEMDQKRLEMMKKGLTRFIREINRAKANINLYKNKGIALPQELTETLTKVDEVAKAVKEAKGPDELEMAVSDLNDQMQLIQEWIHKLPRLVQLPRLLKQADLQIKTLDRTYLNLGRRAKTAKLTEDLKEIFAEFKTAIDEQKTMLAEIKESAKTDLETAMDNLEQEFFSNLDNVYSHQRTIEMALNIKQGLNKISLEMKRADQTLKTLKRKKVDITELTELLNTAKSQFTELKTLAAIKPFDPEAVIAALDELMTSKQEFDDLVEELTGQSSFQPQLNPLPQQNFQFNLPDGYLNYNSGPSSGGFGQNPSNSQPTTQKMEAKAPAQQTCNVNGVELPGRCEDYQGR